MGFAITEHSHASDLLPHTHISCRLLSCFTCRPWGGTISPHKISICRTFIDSMRPSFMERQSTSSCRQASRVSCEQAERFHGSPRYRTQLGRFVFFTASRNAPCTPICTSRTTGSSSNNWRRRCMQLQLSCPQAPNHSIERMACRLRRQATTHVKR